MNTPPLNSHRRKLRLIKKEESNRKAKSKARHKASIDDYDKKKTKPESLIFPFITYDPGLLDTALIAVSLSRTQLITVETIRMNHF